MTVEIVQLLVSGIHRYEGRPADGPAPEPPGELVDSIIVRAGLGIVGDRYFGKTAHRDASVTFMDVAGLPAGADLRQARRNILLRGLDVDGLRGAEVSLDSGSGPVTFRFGRAANPCAWMDVTIGPGAMKALRGKGGVRATPLTDGTLSRGPVEVRLG